MISVQILEGQDTKRPKFSMCIRKADGKVVFCTERMLKSKI